jgi:cell wall-associated NlpC family hydrolase
MIGRRPANGRHFARARILAASLASAVLFAPLAAADPLSAREPASQASAVPATVWHSAQDLAIYALGLIGVDYRFGGTTPERGLDCSGLVRYVFQQVTGVMLPRTSQEISRLGEKIPVAELMPGDLVFFNTRRLQFSHVGIYLGEIVLFMRRGKAERSRSLRFPKAIGKSISTAPVAWSVRSPL